MDDTTIPNSYKTQFKDNLILALQQKVSKLRDKVDYAGDYQGEGAQAVEQLAPTEVDDNNDRYGDTPLMVPQYDARWIYPVDVHWGTLISKKDKLREVTDPTSALMTNAAAAFGRQIDWLILDAAFGVAKTGLKGATNTPFPNDQKLNVQLGGGGADAGMTYDKFLAATEMMLASEVDVDNDEFFMAITAKQNTDLMKIAEVKGDQYNMRPTIKDGLVTSYGMWKFVHLNGKRKGDPLVKKVGNNRLIPAWAKSGLHLGAWEEMTTMLERDASKKYMPRPYASQTHGATRTDEKKVIQIPCKE